MIKRIVSGGQTGVDRAALDVALEKGIPCGGWVPKGRMAEDGIIPATYPNLQETDSENSLERTAFNIRDSDATLLVTRGKPKGGSAYTLKVAAGLGKPYFHADFERESVEVVCRGLQKWLDENQPAILNVAGPRSSEDSQIYPLTLELLNKLFCGFMKSDDQSMKPDE